MPCKRPTRSDAPHAAPARTSSRTRCTAPAAHTPRRVKFSGLMTSGHSCTIRSEHFLGTVYTAEYTVIRYKNIRNTGKNGLFWPKTPKIRPNIHRMPNGRIRMVQLCMRPRHEANYPECLTFEIRTPSQVSPMSSVLQGNVRPVRVLETFQSCWKDISLGSIHAYCPTPSLRHHQLIHAKIPRF